MRVGAGCGPPVHPSSTSTAHADRNGRGSLPYLPRQVSAVYLPRQASAAACPCAPPGDREASRSVTGPAGHQPAEETPSVPLLNLRLTARGAPPQHRVGGRRLVALAGAPSQRYHPPRQPLGCPPPRTMTARPDAANPRLSATLMAALRAGSGTLSHPKVGCVCSAGGGCAPADSVAGMVDGRPDATVAVGVGLIGSPRAPQYTRRAGAPLPQP